MSPLSLIWFWSLVVLAISVVVFSFVLLLSKALLLFLLLSKVLLVSLVKEVKFLKKVEEIDRFPSSTASTPEGLQGRRRRKGKRHWDRHHDSGNESLQFFLDCRSPDIG